ncbi:CBS domain-containing protein [Aquibacillus koreensis]|uniref:CBS domain-containing protein n=1 Tax=Aquibacillus koreensis TaxID=279446 RepID=A0A9X3WLY6_9BACI|nr:cyclic-di-AMP-binding protein CbpB [Aquibacillus koreensis]MCT2538128.1 CBS domain-containing protein [Aquibacillus koreensis]MDC3420651.1 CBS domain-containing protein [Aquibacillus koreensis]
MNNLENLDLPEINVEQLMISSEKVAHVQLGNPLEHALLVLVKSGYSAVPVLDSSYKFKGIIGKTVILNSVLGLERFEMERLSEKKVNEVMNSDTPCLNRRDDFLTCLKTVINHPFVCVVDDEGYFDGIITRRAILKQLNKYLHVIKHNSKVKMTK